MFWVGVKKDCVFSFNANVWDGRADGIWTAMFVRKQDNGYALRRFVSLKGVQVVFRCSSSTWYQRYSIWFSSSYSLLLFSFFLLLVFLCALLLFSSLGRTNLYLLLPSLPFFSMW
ncbi:hypothetical protein HDV57DRAFT_497457 [Trichoderma longibrachiatum]|uniref:Transmembrane protein n=1 Tax=Trichoderma longibrachiatum ATCC 18648 TaxID=983965 RepID=A0A2T4BV33_TRILO|nr:hypothetical protein M440DRAFT_1074963 [Trichoderma longibrachiatum ATCC 18648]